ncbi:MAG: bifunctional aspartate kinase/diaminopimelate decarboxylase, partial [Pseudomonadota bacterium]
MTTSEAAFAASKQPSDSQSGRWVVLKFGGSSVATLPNWQLIAKRLRDRIDTGHRVMVVHSAIRGVSDMLQLALDSAVADEDGPDIADIRSIHVPLATAFEIDVDTVIGGQLAELRQLLAGVRLIREATPRIAARVMASGELMATAMSAAWLVKQGLPLHWHDARDLLTSVPIGNQRQDYLSAVCASDPDPELQAALMPEGIHLTQGFVARHPDGDTVVLGRGGV